MLWLNILVSVDCAYTFVSFRSFFYVRFFFPQLLFVFVMVAVWKSHPGDWCESNRAIVFTEMHYTYLKYWIDSMIWFIHCKLNASYLWTGEAKKTTGHHEWAVFLYYRFLLHLIALKTMESKCTSGESSLSVSLSFCLPIFSALPVCSLLLIFPPSIFVTCAIGVCVRLLRSP